MKKCLLILSLVALSSFQEVSVLSFTNMHVMKAAEGQLGVYTSRILPGDAGKYGFRQEDDMELLVVEKPYRIIEFTADFYENPLDEDKNNITIKNEWKVPVASKGLNRVMLTVKGISSNYKVMGMGDTSLARELQPVSRGLNDSDEFYLLQVPALSADFFVHEGTGSFIDAEFIPLSSAKAAIKALRKNTADAYSLTDIQKLVKATILEHSKEEASTKTTTKKAGTTPATTAKKQPKKAAPVKKTTPAK